MARLILLHGFAGVGKTTIAERYINDHPLTMLLEAERVGEMLGRWLEYEAEARELLFKLSQPMTTVCLEAGHDVIIPMLPTNPDHIEVFEHIAREAGAQFFEIILTTGRQEGVRRLMKRGRWGEKGAPALTEADLPIIEKLYDDMAKTLAARQGAGRITSIEGEQNSTYRHLLSAIGEA